MNMTISVYESYLERMPAIQAIRMRDMAQSVVFAQATPEDSRRIWNAWSNIITTVTNAMADSGNAVFSWNGEIVGISHIKRMFASLFGRTSVEGRSDV